MVESQKAANLPQGGSIISKNEPIKVSCHLRELRY